MASDSMQVCSSPCGDTVTGDPRKLHLQYLSPQPEQGGVSCGLVGLASLRLAIRSNACPAVLRSLAIYIILGAASQAIIMPELEQTARTAWWRDVEPSLFANTTIRRASAGSQCRMLLSSAR